MDRILELDTRHDRATVQPGVVLDALRDACERYDHTARPVRPPALAAPAIAAYLHLSHLQAAARPPRQARPTTPHRTETTMETTTIVTMVLIMGFVWGGFALLLTKALSAESHKHQDV